MKHAYGYGIIEPDGAPYIEEICVWGPGDAGRVGAEQECESLNGELAEEDPAKYRVVELFWESEKT